MFRWNVLRGRNTDSTRLQLADMICSEKFGEVLCFQRGFQQGFADFSCFAGVAKRRDHSVESLILLRNCNGFALKSDYHR